MEKWKLRPTGLRAGSSLSYVERDVTWPSLLGGNKCPSDASGSKGGKVSLPHSRAAVVDGAWKIHWLLAAPQKTPSGLAAALAAPNNRIRRHPFGRRESIAKSAHEAGCHSQSVLYYKLRRI